MKRMIFVSLIGLFVGIIPCSPAFSLVPYDDFSGTSIDLSKWRSGEFVREIRDLGGGDRRLVLARSGISPLAIGSYNDVQQNNLNFNDPNSVNSIQADVTVLKSDITSAGLARARLAGRWYNDGTTGGGYTGDIYAEVTIWADPTVIPTGLKGWWYVGRYTGVSESSINQLGAGSFTQSISLGTTYTLSIAYDGTNQFTFKIGSESVPFNTGLTHIGNANNPWKGLGVRTQINNADSSCYISATFDNVYKNGGPTPYDDFNDPSLAINSSKWNPYEYVTEIISGGKLRSKSRSSAASALGTTINNALEIAYPVGINAIQANVTPLAYDNPGIFQVADISGTFYNDGTGTSGVTGDIVGEVAIGGSGTTPVAMWQVYKYTSSDGSTSTVVKSGVFSTSIVLGSPYTLYLHWSGNEFTFKFNDEETHYKPDPGTSILPAERPFRRLRTAIIPQTGKTEATIEAQFDDVMVGYVVPDDNFSEAFIDEGKWNNGEFVREIDSANHRLILDLASPNPVASSSFPYKSSNQLSFADPGSVNSMQAYVTLLAYDVRYNGNTRARLGGRWYNNGTGTPGSDMTGDIWAEVGLRADSSGVYAAWAVSRFTNADGTATSTLGSGTFSTTIAVGTAYTLFISYDSTANSFTFKVGSEEHNFTPSGSINARKGDPNLPSKGPSTHVQINDDESFGYVGAAFGNVYVNGGPYDDFSLLTIDQTKWSNYEFVREISDGELRSKVRSGSGSNAHINTSLESLYPSRIHSIRAKVTPTAYLNANGVEVIARIGGIYYNDKTPGSTSYLGDVAAGVRIGGFGTAPEVKWQVHRYTDDTGQNWEVLKDGTLASSIDLGKTYTLFLDWDGSQFTFRFEGTEDHYTPSTDKIAPHVPTRQVGNRINNPAGKEAMVEAFYDDVVMNSPKVQVVPSSAEFNNVLVGTTADRTVTVSNPGDGWLEITNPVSPNSPFDVTDSTTCPDPPFTLDPLASCTVVVSFSPTVPGTFSDSIIVSTNDPDHPTLTIPLHGTGVVPDIAVTPLDLVFGNVLVGTTKDLATTVKNEGTADLALGTIGPFSALFSRVTGPGICTDGQTLHPTESCAVTIRFTPPSPGPFGPTPFTIPSNDPDENPVTVNLSGTGVVPDIAVTPLDLVFGSVLVGTTKDLPTTVKNEGTADLALGTIGTVSAPFSRVAGPGACTNGQVLHPNDTCTITIRFTPPSPGPFGPTPFTIPSNDPDENPVTVNLSGTGVVPDISVTPLDLVFGNVLVGTTKDLATTVKNEGTADLILGTIGTISAPFSRVAGPGACTDGQSLHPTESCTVTIRFAPPSPGPFGPTPFTIPSNDPDENPVTVNLSGKGVKFLVNPGQGTYGTAMTITGSGFGTSKNKVLVGTVALKVVDWNATTIHATLGKAMLPDAYDVTVLPKTKVPSPITEAKAFEVKLPEIDSPPGSGPSGGTTPIIIRGKFFSAKKGKVYLEQNAGPKACKVLSWTVNVNPGVDEIQFLVPKKLPTGLYAVTVTNSVGSVTKIKWFEVN